MKSPKTVLQLRKMNCLVYNTIKDRLVNLIMLKGEWVDYQYAYFLDITGYANDITNIILSPTEKIKTDGENIICFLMKGGLTKEFREVCFVNDDIIDIIEHIESL